MLGAAGRVEWRRRVAATRCVRVDGGAVPALLPLWICVVVSKWKELVSNNVVPTRRFMWRWEEGTFR